jgi:hypothetical protein
MLCPSMLDSAKISLQASTEGWQALADEASRRLRLGDQTDRLILPGYRIPRTLWKRLALGFAALSLVAIVIGAIVYALRPSQVVPVVSPLSVPAPPLQPPPHPSAPVPMRKPSKLLSKLRAPIMRPAPKVERGPKIMRKPKPQPARRKPIRL